MNHPFKLKNATLLMALAAIYPVAAYSAAGVAQFAVGDVSVRRGAAAAPLAKGQSIDSGDSIVTGAAGQAQIRFSDGGLVSLSPNSQFNIDKYGDTNDGGADSFAVSFLRGSMRAITGLIGKRSRDNYKITTNTATIGIRGSALSAKINPDGTMDVAGEQDGIEVCTNAGCVGLIVGEVVRVTDSNTLPVRTSQRSNVPPLVAREDIMVPENPVRLSDSITIPEVPLVTGISALFAFGNGPVDQFPRGGQAPSTGGGNFEAGQLVKHVGAPSGSTTVQKTSMGEGSFGTVAVGGLGFDDPAFIGWGYWDAGRLIGTDALITPYEGVHYLVGRPTPLAQMPITGSAAYSLVGYTSPTAYDGATLRVGELLNAGLNVDFSIGRVNAFVNTRFTKDGEYVPVQVSGYGSVVGATFSANSDSSPYGNGYFSGFFTGDGASRAGLVYGVDGSAVGDVRGSAAFVKNLGNGITQQAHMSAMFASSDGAYADTSPRGDDTENNGAASFIGNQLTRHDDGSIGIDSVPGGYTGISRVFASTSPVSSFGSLGNVADADFIGWGFWSSGTSTYNRGSTFAGVHYLVGRPTPMAQMPVSGSAKYNLAGWTAPTAYDGETLRVGQLLSAGLNVDFGNVSVNAFFNTQFTKDGQPVPVQISGVGSINGATFSNNGSTFHATGCNSGFGNGFFNGFFIGNQAIKAALIYGVDDSAVGNVRGAAAFQKSASVGGDAFSDVTGIAAMFASGDGFILDSVPRGGESPYTGSAFFVGTQLFQHNDNASRGYGGYGGGSSVLSTRSAVTHSGALGAVTDTDFIGWGYWAKGQQNGVRSSSLADVHYLVGRPTPYAQMPVAGTAAYALHEGSAPTATDSSGKVTAGSLLSSSILNVNFTAGTVATTINTQFGQGSSAVGVTIADIATISGSTFRNGPGMSVAAASHAGDQRILTSGGPSSSVNISGFFTGNLAARAGLIYSKSNTPVGLVQGAAVFTQRSSSGLVLPNLN